MTTFLGFPILLRGLVYGNLYLSEKEDGGEFDEEDEAVLTRVSIEGPVTEATAGLVDPEPTSQTTLTHGLVLLRVARAYEGAASG